MLVKCPNCKLEQEWSTENPFRPFCSKRCRLIDLGAWANEDYKISEPASNQMPDHLSDLEEDDGM